MALSVKYTALLLLPLIAAAIAVLSVSLTACTLYLWVGVMSRLDSIPLDSSPLKSLANYAPSFRLPIPRAILTGIDLSIAHNRPDLWAFYVSAPNTAAECGTTSSRTGS